MEVFNSQQPYEQDMMPNFGFSGLKLYSKQRILTTDKQKYHTRLSSFLKYSYHENKFMKNNLDLNFKIQVLNWDYWHTVNK